MELFSFNETGQHPSDVQNKTGIVGRRWSCQFDYSKESIDFGFEYQLKYDDTEWNTNACHYYNFRFILNPKEWKIDKYSLPYDGWHHGVTIGPFCFGWMT